MSIERDAHYRRIIKDAIQIGFNNGLRSRIGAVTLNSFSDTEIPNWCYEIAFEMGVAQPLTAVNTPIPSQAEENLPTLESILVRLTKAEQAISDVSAAVALVRP